jgi:hypothetical protein
MLMAIGFTVSRLAYVFGSDAEDSDDRFMM